MSPLSNAFIKPDKISAMEKFYPLHAFVCKECFLVQLDQFESPDHIFSDYLYFSSYSDSWLAHAKEFCTNITKFLGLNSNSLVVEIASNDGYLLQNFVASKIPCLGIEPAENVAKVAIDKGVPTRSMFFGAETAKSLKSEGLSPDLIVGNNVLAHVPDINSFVKGLKILLAENGVISIEFPHLLQLINNNQFDTIYHEHFSYLSLLAVEKIFNAHNLEIFKVDELNTHGGSLRIYGKHSGNNKFSTDPSVLKVRKDEATLGLDKINTYINFKDKVNSTKRSFLSFLIQAKSENKKIAAYGAAAKGNTLLNFCGVREDFIDYVVDRNPYKQGTFLPGTHIPVGAPEKIQETKPDYVVILPWNLKAEVSEQLSFIRQWGGKFVVPIPEVEVF
jgi:hypothetical protein